MQCTLEDLKRKQICPILFRQNWDYKNKPSQEDLFSLCLAEMMRWQYRKGRSISYDVLVALISRLAIERNIDRMEIGKVQLALKGFVNSELYSRVENLIANVEIQIAVNNNHIITHAVPSMGSINDNTVIITWNNNLRTTNDIKQSYETKVASVWTFYSLNRYPSFYNLYLKEDKVESIHYKPDQFYIRDSKSHLLRMNKIIESNNLYPAPYEVCQGCDRRIECLTMKTKTNYSQKN